MNDYTFGNYICNLRTGLRLSQYQLGKLVGVSDKAVSKWENGNAKPRIKTCIRLAEVLGVSIDELLSCKTVRRKGGASEVKKKYFEKAQKALYEKYGPTPPIECIGRLESEQLAIKSDDLIMLFEVLNRIAEKGRENGSPVYARGTFGSWFSLWLLGGSRVNPLPPHYHCPCCHKTIFRYDAKDGWDLPEKMCCGQKMRRDGHRIPFEGHLAQCEKNVSLEVNVSADFLKEASAEARAYCKDKKQVIPLCRPEADENFAAFYALLPMDMETPTLNENGMWETDVYRLYERNDLGFLWLIAKKDFSLLKGMEIKQLTECELTSQKVLEGYYAEQKGIFPDIAEAADKDAICFSKLLKIEGMMHGTDVWHNNGELLERGGAVRFSELIATREDVWDMVMSHIPKNSAAGAGFVLKVMNDCRMGRYARYGEVPEETKRLLKEMGVPDWCLEQMAHIRYLFNRAHLIELLIDYLTLEWCRQNVGIEYVTEDSKAMRTFLREIVATVDKNR